jgi:GntR family transcriptional regulator / MocR family aminotransferase
MRYQANLTIPIVLARNAPSALHDQIAEQVGAAVDRGLLVRGCQLPSTRTLATLLGVSRGVTTAAYDVLFARGYLHSQRGSGTYVSRPDRPPAQGRHRRPVGSDPGPTVDLRPGRLAPEAFPLAAWRTAWRRASFRCPPATSLPALGLAELRTAVAEHLLRTRGIPVDEAAVVITGGVAHGLRVVLDVLGLDAPEVALEEPSPPAVHRTVAPAGRTPVALPVDAEGARLHGLPPSCRAIVVRPDAQVPLGRVLSAHRRHEAARWAAATGGTVIELACDAVVRAAAGGLPRLTALAPDASVLIGGFCELFTPALKLGYAVVPAGLVDPIGRRIDDRGDQPSYVAQLAVASLLADGTVARLAHRRARAYATKRHLVRTALAPLVEDAATGIRIAGRDAVDTAVLYLPDGSDADVVVGDLAERGVRVDTLAPYHWSARPVPPALVVGYGHQPDAELRRACLRLRDALTS